MANRERIGANRLVVGAHYGTLDFLAQRVTAVIMAIYTLVIIGGIRERINEALLPKGKLWLKVLGAILGSVVYRFIIAMALRIDLPTECLKLVSAVIVALAIGLPALRSAKGGKVKC